MFCIRPAYTGDISRIAEILIFAKRTAYRPIFQNDQVSFGKMQVLPLAQQYLSGEESLEGVFVYEDGFVQGLVSLTGDEVCQLLSLIRRNSSQKWFCRIDCSEFYLIQEARQHELSVERPRAQTGSAVF